ncbi:hypothetical protein PR048_019659 [Dryococelus australis]|uniref:Retrotransposon gag domain-containing protein n=1 Tax=Dryococelus australis TaxID=614101 RepID=A0ABQ9H4F2_9NEOP|nr:hypothetical protein PR048_019659 [Dryococelus australis]
MEFTNPSSWPAWERIFLRYMSVSGYNSKPHKEKIDILLYLLGEHADEIWPQIQPAQETQEQALQAFWEYFNPQSNTIFEQYKVNSLVQLHGESVGEFVTTSHTVVVGMDDKKMCEQLQLLPKLTLEAAVLVAKQAELQYQ